MSLTAQWYTASAITYNYNGGVQTYTVPYTGTYKLTVYGACGGAANAGLWPEAPQIVYTTRGGYGGVATGDVKLSAGQVLYICVGGKGYDGYGGKLNGVDLTSSSAA